jgi:hypothetical protein
MRLTYLDLSLSTLKKCNANPHRRSTIEEKHCVAQQPPSVSCGIRVGAGVAAGQGSITGIQRSAWDRPYPPRELLLLTPGIVYVKMLP